MTGENLKRRNKTHFDLFEDIIKRKLNDPQFLNDKPDNYIEEIFLASREPGTSREMGQFMTPIEIAQLMINLAVSNNVGHSFLDPSVGCGIFPFLYLKKMSNIGLIDNLKIDMYDIDDTMINVTKARLTRFVGENKISLYLRNEDFMLSTNAKDYDVVVCNPPYIKSNRVKNRENYLKHLKSRYGFEIPKLNNLDSFFLLKSLKILKRGGTFVFITPNGFLSSVSGSIVREFLLKEMYIKAFIYIDTPEFVFEDGMSSALITYGEKKKEENKENTVKFIKIVKFNGINEILNAIQTGTISPPNTIHIYPQIELKCSEKWLSKFEDTYDIGISGIKFVNLGKYFRVKRGIATGANSYFTLSIDEIKKWNIPQKYVEPIISKATYAKPPIFTYDDFLLLMNSRKKAFLLNVEEEEPETGLKDYLNYGMKLGVDKNYLCKMRKKWFFMEKRNPPTLFVKVFQRENVNFIWNKAGIKNLSCFHGLYPYIQDENIYKAVILYSLTTYGRKSILKQIRKYGGGLLKLEPRDVEQIKIPDFLEFSQNDMNKINSLFDSFEKIGYERLKDEAQNLFDSIFRNASPY
jgi:adenine-specific DNA-methyltransferase